MGSTVIDRLDGTGVMRCPSRGIFAVDCDDLSLLGTLVAVNRLSLVFADVRNGVSNPHSACGSSRQHLVHAQAA